VTIVFEAVTVSFPGADGPVPVLAETTLTIDERRVALIGPNGSGKSTLARLVNGLVTATTGRVLVDGLDPDRDGREVRRRVGFAFTELLGFKLLPRRRDTDMRNIELAVVGDKVTIPVPVAADNTFALERSQRALDDDALVIPDRKTRSMTWRTDIRTPGLPPDTRRLGDLRLECLVGIEADLVSDPSFIGRLVRARGYCDQREVSYLFFADRPLWSVTLIAGSRRVVLPIDQLYAGISRNPMTRSELDSCDCEILIDRTYYAPLGDRSWPDDTLIYLEYMDDSVAPAASSLPNGRSR